MTVSLSRSLMVELRSCIAAEECSSLGSAQGYLALVVLRGERARRRQGQLGGREIEATRFARDGLRCSLQTRAL